MSPQRIQRRRTRGYQLPEGAVYVGRPTKWGNPIDWRTYRGTRVHEDGEGWQPSDSACRQWAVTDFQAALLGWDGTPAGSVAGSPYPTAAEIRAELAGRDLACWCPLPKPGQTDWCHAAVLLQIANGGDA